MLDSGRGLDLMSRRLGGGSIAERSPIILFGVCMAVKGERVVSLDVGWRKVCANMSTVSFSIVVAMFCCDGGVLAFSAEGEI